LTARSLRVLVVDDNRSAADALARILQKRGDDVEACYDGADAIARIQERPPDLVFTDLKMEPVSGLAVLQAARDLRPPVEVIVFTAYSTVDVAVRAMRMGARDFLTKPVTVDQVAARLETLRDDLDKAGQAETPGELRFIARSRLAIEMAAALRAAADVPSPVWLEGEVGSGRGHAAHALHDWGRRGQPFHVFDIARDVAWPDAGTVLLPEVDSLAPDLQVALHRRLARLPEGVRLVSTASPGGRRLVAEGRLSSDLYYALAVVVISVPPLRQRVEDIVPLAQDAVSAFAARYGRAAPEIRDAEREQLLRHGWPGNIRELRNLAERAVVLGTRTLDLEVIEPAPTGLPKIEAGFNLSAYLESVEKEIIEEALKRAGGDRGDAADLLGLERNTLRYKLKKYGLLDR
jgi:DNA-binding NtrC family response regulator